MKIKRLLSLLLACIFLLAGCNSASMPDGTDEDQSTTDKATDSPTEEPTEEVTEDLTQAPTEEPSEGTTEIPVEPITSGDAAEPPTEEPATSGAVTETSVASN